MQGKQRFILAFGDSLTAGYYAHGALFAPYAAHLNKITGIKAVEHGVPGMTSDELLETLDDVLKHQQPGDVELFAFVALGGTNDMGGRATPDQVAKNMRLIAAKARAFGFKHVCLMTIPLFPNAERVERIVSKIAATNKLLQQLGEKGDVQIIPLAQSVLPSVAGIWDDGLHNNPKGYELYAEVVKTALRI